MCAGGWWVCWCACVRLCGCVCVYVCVCVTSGEQCRDSILLLSQIWESLSPSLSNPRPSPPAPPPRPAPPQPLWQLQSVRGLIELVISRFFLPYLVWGLGFSLVSMCDLGIRAYGTCHSRHVSFLVSFLASFSFSHTRFRVSVLWFSF